MHVKAKNHLLSNNTPFSSTPSFLEEISHPHPYCQIIPPLIKERGLNYDNKLCKLFALTGGLIT